MRIIYLLFLTLAAAAVSAGERDPHTFQGEWPVPFVLPFDDNQAGVTHFGSQYTNSASKALERVTINENGQFEAGGRRVRFWGVNITAGSCFPEHNDAEKIAARLAKFGINVVRFHHMENNWGGESLIDYSAGTSRQFNKSNLDKLDYFIAQLKKHGIYSNLNLQTSRDYLTGDGLSSEALALNWKARHVFSTVAPAILTLEQEHARNLLSHRNPYTKLNYAEDPGVAFVEINNENSIFQQYFDGNVDKWPTEYKTLLRSAWNKWLRKKYSSHQALLKAWQVVEQALGKSLLSDAHLQGAGKGWEVQKFGGAELSVNTEATNKAVAIDIRKRGEASWNVQMFHPLPAFEAGEVYTLSFTARATQHEDMQIALMQNYEPWQSYQRIKVPLTKQWQEYQYTFVVNVSDNRARLNFGNMGSQTGLVEIKNIAYRAGGVVGKLSDTERLEDSSLAVNQSAVAYTSARNQDWIHFLYSIDDVYWSTMQDFLKKQLKVQALTYGTIASLSPPAIQKKFGYIDSHIYWAHPYFPNRQWDSNDWLIENESMVNTLQGNTLDSLARQRVAGIPFVVSEYQHSMPNSFMAESALMIAAYGALQDWDAIYFFSYEVGPDGWDAGFFNGFMQTNNHPSAMANLGIAGNLFRRADVSIARNAQFLPFQQQQQLQAIATSGQSWNVTPADYPEQMKGFAFVHRTGLQLDDKLPSKSLDAVDNSLRLSADTDELNWDVSKPSQGVLSINTPRTKSILGYLEKQDFVLGQVKVAFGNLQLHWATWSLSARKGQFDELHKGAQLLLVATGRTENTDMQWKTVQRTSVGANWGKAPSVIEAVPFTVQLPVPATRVSAWALDEKGLRHHRLPVSKQSGAALITADGTDKTLWYEIVIAPQND